MRDDLEERVERHARLSTTLAAMSDAELRTLVADAEDAAIWLKARIDQA
ncbi:hypothetical protein [Actinoplanes sp. NBRC 103695]|nr:hypothetical protein [Actinoplanes sp. NBRC 103695]GLZ02099.1 hypothetical protein Acsp02_93500 [Actinoplanes sp. NBRC 103695]